MHDLTAQLVHLDRPASQRFDNHVETILGDVATHTAFLLERTGVLEMVAQILTEPY
jgi:hypothetical protein